MSGFASPALSSAHAQQILASIRDGLRVVLTSPTRVEPGDTATAALVPAAPEIDATDLANGVLNLAWTAKDVIFNNQSVVGVPSNGDMEGDLLAAGAGVLGGQPFPLPLGVVGGDTTPTTSNVLGVLGQVFGGFALPRIKVRLEVHWIVRDQNGNPLQEDEDFIATEGLGSPTVSLLLPPIVADMRFDKLDEALVEVRCLWAQVTLQLGTEMLGPFEVGPVPVVVLPLLVPTALALFSEHNFGLTYEGTVIIMVPKHSPVGAAEPLFKLLRRIETVVSKLKRLRGFATLLLGLDTLVSSVPDQPRIRFAAADGVPNFKKVTIKRSRYLLGIRIKKKVTFNNMASSLLVFGLPGTRVGFYNDKDFNTALGSFEVEIKGAFVAAVRNLDTDPTQPPEVLPAGSLIDHHLPVPGSGANAKWHNALSSAKFGDTWPESVRPTDLIPPRRLNLICAPPKPATKR
jgi:hypothetical protein